MFFSPVKGTVIRSDNQIDIYDSNLKSELVVDGLDFPTTMAFLGPNDMLVLEKDNGRVLRVTNNSIVEILDVRVNNSGENGLLGIAIGNKNITTSVFLFFTESDPNNAVAANHVYRYELVGNDLINPKLLLDIPLSIESVHNGGKLLIGPDDNLYITVGNLGDTKSTKALNNITGKNPDRTGGILRLTQTGDPVPHPHTGEYILGEEYPANLYYAYGIRNSFGIAFDPITHNLWDTENGPGYGDEINLVEPGFNSGGDYAYGMSASEEGFDPNKLSNFEGRGRYSDPELTWPYTVAPTAILFLNSDRLGTEYENDMFVADFNFGNIYHFELDNKRTELNLTGMLRDEIIDEDDPILAASKFAEAPGGIIDMQTGPDGYLYIISISVKISDCDPKAPGCVVNNGIEGSIFRIVPATR